MVPPASYTRCQFRVSESRLEPVNSLTVIAEDLLIKHPRLALVPHVGDPDGPDANASFSTLLLKVIPEGLV